MRYYLRNKDKIKKEYGAEMLERIVDSLDVYFKNNISPKSEVWEGEPYKVFIVADIGHTVNDIAFYSIRYEYNALRIAFKEFIG